MQHPGCLFLYQSLAHVLPLNKIHSFVYSGDFDRLLDLERERLLERERDLLRSADLKRENIH